MISATSDLPAGVVEVCGPPGLLFQDSFHPGSRGPRRELPGDVINNHSGLSFHHPSSLISVVHPL